MKNPSINITKKDLQKVLSKLNISCDIDTFWKECQNCPNERLVIKSLDNKQSDIELFNQCLFQKRLDLKHKGFIKITSEHRDYKQLVLITEQAKFFCEAFELTKSEGFKAYIDIAFNIIKDFQVTKIMSWNERIFAYHDRHKKIKNDPNVDLTDKLLQAYIKEIKMPDFYADRLDFVKTSELIIKYNAKPSVWIKAQFKELEFTGNIPEPNQLHSDNALKRYQKYILNNPTEIDVLKLKVPKIIDQKPNFRNTEDAEQRRLLIQKIKQNESNSI